MSLVYFRNVKLYAKGRWHGRRLGDIVEELGPNVNVKGDLNHVLRNKDIVEYSMHVHEPPVNRIQLPQSILFENDDFVVVNKPSGVPVHPTVNYHKHSVTEMLKEAYGSLYPCFRLDRLTSGVLVLAKNPQFASRFQTLETDKVYLARVRLQDLMQPPAPKEDWEQLCNGNEIAFKDPIIVFNGKRGYSGFVESAKNAKPASTTASLVGHDGELATLRLKLQSGRTHQIRKHLAMHGYPIHNDEIYADGGRLRRLFREQTPESFDAVWENAENLRKSKLTGKKCSDCGIELYDTRIAQLDLHCFQYSFEEYAFEAPPPFPLVNTL